MTINGVLWLIDDDAATRDSISQWLELAGLSVRTFEDTIQPLSELTPNFGGVILTDVQMPELDGTVFQRKVAEIDASIPVILMTGHGDVAMAVEAMRSGAYDFLEKPFEPETLIGVIKRASERRNLVMENRRLQQKLSAGPEISDRLIGASKAMEALRNEVIAIADTDVSVLIEGETGTGKEVTARCLHEFSKRSDKNFVALNCGAIPDNIFESELFGHEAGAFTGAQKKRIGKLEHAHGGTLFLDEITSMSLHHQVKFLRFLQEREFERLGSNETIEVNVRVISACNTDLKEAVAKGEFRQDLYYRLNVVTVFVPPLKQRETDIALLFEYFAGKAGRLYDREVPSLSLDGLSALMVHSWPGNIRELKNVAERYVLSTFEPADRIREILGFNSQMENTSASLASRTDKFERYLLASCLQQNKGDIQKSMLELGLPRRTLNQKMQKYGLRRTDFK
jgi:two-component system, NtrC family, C4-dicarboxylate transport response regulator DctD